MDIEPADEQPPGTGPPPHESDQSRTGRQQTPERDLAELAHRQGVQPPRSADDLIQPGCSTRLSSWTSSWPTSAPTAEGIQAVRERLLAQLSELPYVEGSPWREDRVNLVDPNTQETVCSLAYRDAVVLAFEIEQAAARVLAGYTLRAIMEWRDQNP